MLENKYAKEYLEVLFKSRGKSLQDVPELISGLGLSEIDDLPAEIGANHYGGSAIRGQNLAIAGLAIANENSPISLIALLIETREDCCRRSEVARNSLEALKLEARKEPNDPEKMAGLVVEFALVADAERALAAFQQVSAHLADLSIDTQQDCYCSAGWIHSSRGKYEEALACFRRVLELGEAGPTNNRPGAQGPYDCDDASVNRRSALENVLFALAKLGRIVEAIAVVEEYHRDFGRLPEHESNLLAGLGLQSDIAFIDFSIRKLSGDGPASADRSGVSDWTDVKNRSARRYLQALYSSDRTSPVPLPELEATFPTGDFEYPLVELRFLRQAGAAPEALRFAIWVLACAAENAPTAVVAELIETAEECYCQCAAAAGNLPRLEEEAEDDPQNGEKLARLGFTLNALEDRAAAQVAFTRALENTSSLSFYAHRDCVNNIGWDHFIHGEYEEALGWFEHAARFGEAPSEEGTGQTGPVAETSDRSPYSLALENVLLALAKLGRRAEAAKGVQEYHRKFGRLPAYERLALETLGLEPDVMFVRSRIQLLAAHLAAERRADAEQVMQP